jgi:hypothetical protein
MAGYLRPVDPVGGRISSYWAHTRRTTPSSEAGVDYYCPIGTPVRAAGDGVVFATGGNVNVATGRYITLDLDDGRRVRYLHLSRYANAFGGDRVGRGQIIGYSGASGYGSEFFGGSSLASIPGNTGGPHVHTTLWSHHVYQFGRYPVEPTLDFENYVDVGSTAGESATPFPEEEEEEMFTIYRSGGAVLIVGNGSIMELGPGLTTKTGVDGAETLASFVSAGAKVVDLDRRQFDVVRVHAIATSPAPAQISPDIIRGAIKAEFAAASIDAAVDDSTIDAIADRVADEQDRRARERLEL